MCLCIFFLVVVVLFFLMIWLLVKNHKSSHSIHVNEPHTTGSPLQSKLPKQYFVSFFKPPFVKK